MDNEFLTKLIIATPWFIVWAVDKLVFYKMEVLIFVGISIAHQHFIGGMTHQHLMGGNGISSFSDICLSVFIGLCAFFVFMALTKGYSVG